MSWDCLVSLRVQLRVRPRARPCEERFCRKIPFLGLGRGAFSRDVELAGGAGGPHGGSKIPVIPELWPQPWNRERLGSGGTARGHRAQCPALSRDTSPGPFCSVPLFLFKPAPSRCLQRERAGRRRKTKHLSSSLCFSFIKFI